MIVTVTLKSDSHNRHITPNCRNPKHFMPSSCLRIDHLTSNQATLTFVFTLSTDTEGLGESLQTDKISHFRETSYTQKNILPPN